MEIQDAKVRLDQMVPRERVETLAILGLQDFKVQLDFQEIQVTLAKMAPVLVAHLAHLVIVESRV